MTRTLHLFSFHHLNITLARPTPPIYKSPITPTGHIFFSLVQHIIRLVCQGASRMEYYSNVIPPLFDRIISDQIDASVAPLVRLLLQSENVVLFLSGKESGINLHYVKLNVKKDIRNEEPTCSNAKSMIAGTVFQIVIPLRSTVRINSCMSLGSRIITNIAPVLKAPKISYTDRSKHMEEIPIIRSSSFTSYFLIYVLNSICNRLVSNNYSFWFSLYFLKCI